MEYQSEHAPRGDNDSKASDVEYSPTEDELKLVKKIKAKYQRAKAGRAGYDVKWLDRYKMFRGQQWDSLRPRYRHAEVFNMIFQIIQSQVPILTDSKPKFEYQPQEPTDREFAELMNDVSSNDWEKGHFLFKLTEMVYISKFYGTAISHLGWDHEANMGAGAVCFNPEELQFMFPDPDGDQINGDRETSCAFFVKAKATAIDKIKAKYPDKASAIKADVIDLLDATKTDVLPMRNLQIPTSDRTVYEGSNFNLPDSSDKKAVVITCYYRDHTCDEEESQDEGGNSVYERRMRYPKGRKTVICNDVVLEDDHNESMSGLFPWQKLVNYVLPNEFWGISEIEPLEGPQKIFNKLISFVLDTVTLTGNPIWIIDTSSGVDPENLTSAPGLVVEKNPGSEVRRESGVQLQPYIIQIINQIKEWMDQISGAQDITRGMAPGGVTANAAIENLQNAAQTRIRQQARNIDDFLLQFGDAYKELALTHYTAPRVYRTTRKDGSFKYFKAHFEMGEDGHRRAFVQEYTENGMPSAELREVVLRGQLDLSTSTGTSLPFSKAAKKDELMDFYRNGLIDDEEVLKGVDYPNWEAVLARMNEKKAAQAAAAAAASGQPAA